MMDSPMGNLNPPPLIPAKKKCTYMMSIKISSFLNTRAQCGWLYRAKGKLFFCEVPLLLARELDVPLRVGIQLEQNTCVSAT